MNDSKTKRGSLWAAVLAIVGLSFVLGSQAVGAETCTSEKTTLTGIIAGSPQCADFNKVGVTLPRDDLDGDNRVTYRGDACDFTVTTTGPVGSTPSTSFKIDPVDGKPICSVQLVLTKGVTGANSCQFIYPNGVPGGDTVTNTNKNKTIPAKSLSVCTDEVVVERNARLLLDVGVALPQGCTNPSEAIEIGIDDPFDLCYTVTNIGDVDLLNVAVNGQTVAINLPSGGDPVTFTLEALPYEEAGTFTQFATATADGDVTSNTDTAVVAVAAAPEDPATACDDATQFPADGNNRLYASFDPAKPEQNYECAPATSSTNGNKSGRQCLNQCVLTADGSACERSGEWEVDNDCLASGTEGALPYCWEIRENPICEYDIGPPAKYWKEVSKTVTYLRKNPYIMQSCTSSGGREDCITYCFLFPGETASACPAGAYVY